MMHFILHPAVAVPPPLTKAGGWKHTFNNLRLIIQPILLLWLVSPWLAVFPNHYLWLSFHQLIAFMNQFYSYFPDG